MNLWILTEESISYSEITKIIEESSKKHSLDIKLETLSIQPYIVNDIFQHEYHVTGFSSTKINNIYICGIQAYSQNPFVDFLVFLQEEKPNPEDLFKNCIYAIEATKTNTYDSRNTAMGQRSSKFVHLSFFLEGGTYPTQPVMYKTHPQAAQDHDSVEFIGRLLNHLPIRTEFWGAQKTHYKKFKDIADLIDVKNRISDKNTRVNDVPIYVKDIGNRIEISGRLSNPGSTGTAAKGYTGEIKSDPNQGQLAIIAKSIREFGYKGPLRICDHDLDPKVVAKQRNKFIKFAKYIDFEIDNCSIKNVDFNQKYYKYSVESKEKIASILAQVILVNKGMKTIFENHGGCEKSFIDTDVFQQKGGSNRYEIFPKKYSTTTRKIPDLIMADQLNLIIYLYEGKLSTTKNDGLNDIKKYHDLEQDILSKDYPGYSFERRLIIEGGKKDNDPIVSFQLDEDSKVRRKGEFI